MPYVTMGGPSLTLPSFVIAVKPSLSIMQWFATWGFPTIHHNEIRNLTVSLLTEVCPNVAVEPHVQPLSKGFFRQWLYMWFNHCLKKPLDWHQPIPMMGHDLMYMQEDFGTLARMPILM